MSWEPCQDFIMCFSDETGEARSGEEMDYFIEALRKVGNEYDFDISHWGGSKEMQRHFAQFETKRVLDHIVMKAWKEMDEEDRQEQVLGDFEEHLRNEK